MAGYWDSDMTRPVSVRGGAKGVEAHYDDMVVAARLFGHAACDTAGLALALHGYLARPDLLASATLDPVGSALFEARLLAALDGPAGVTWLTARCAALDASLRLAASAYLAADRLDTGVAPALDAVAGGPRALCDGAARLAGGDAAGALRKVLADDPQLADLGVDMVAGLLGGSVPSGARLLAVAFDDGTPHVTRLGGDAGADRGGPPHDVFGVLAGLARRNAGRAGEVDVRFLDGCADGRRRVIVGIPGTKDWSLALHNGNVTSIATNLRALGGQMTSYEQGVVEAMRRAGVRRADDVLVVGHSEGGLVAIAMARHLAGTGEFTVSHVITAGAPIGELAGSVPSRVDVLALENEGDAIPHLDGAANVDRANITTVALQRDHGDVVDNHDLVRSYLPGAEDVDASDDPSVRAYLGGMRGFLNATTVRTRTYLITRTYQH